MGSKVGRPRIGKRALTPKEWSLRYVAARKNAGFVKVNFWAPESFRDDFNRLAEALDTTAGELVTMALEREFGVVDHG
ncbi:MAG: hypothetical protein ING69_10595 [Rhodocyclaceae bacterium]|nr:hypothetical protein [Rhodocyclaceae bacterium]